MPSDAVQEFTGTVVDAEDLRRPGDPDKGHIEKAFLIMHPFSKKRSRTATMHALGHLFAYACAWKIPFPTLI